MSTADEALRVLRAELSVAPSPDFQARVRTRVAQQRAHTFRWAWIVTALAAAALLVALVWLRSQRTLRAPAVAAESPAPPPSTAGPEPIAEPTVRVPRLAAPPGAAAVRALVPAGEDVRIARYAASVRQHPFEADTLPQSDPGEPLAEPAPLAVAPLDTVPLVPDEGSHR